MHAASRSFMNSVVHEFVNMADHTKYNETAFKEFLNPRRFAHIIGASKYMRSARNLIPLAPLVHGFTSEPKVRNKEEHLFSKIIYSKFET